MNCKYKNTANIKKLQQRLSENRTKRGAWSNIGGNKLIKNNNEIVQIGDKGDKGSRGIVGNQGIQGVQGIQGLRGLQGIQGAQGLRGSQGNVGLIGPSGGKGDDGNQGNIGLRGGTIYKFTATDTEDSDPSNGRLKFNNSDLSSVNQIFVNNEDSTGTNQSSWYSIWNKSTNNSKGYLVIQEAIHDGIVIATFEIANVVSKTNYHKIDVVYISGTTFIGSNNDDFVVLFSRTGDKGESNTSGDGIKGEQGTDGIKGEQGTDGIKGEQGTDGIKGEFGLTGTKGEQGTDGNKGEFGLTGTKGEQGTDGNKGEFGLTGAKGESGTGNGASSGNQAIPYEADSTFPNEYRPAEFTWQFQQFISPATANYTQMTLFASDSTDWTTTGYVSVAIYSNESGSLSTGDEIGKPGSLLGGGRAQPGTQVGKRFFTIPFNLGEASLIANTPYWVAWVTDNGGEYYTTYNDIRDSGQRGDLSPYGGRIRISKSTNTSLTVPLLAGETNIHDKDFWFRIGDQDATFGGEKGEKGAEGLLGVMGEKGPSGISGIVGDKGAPGFGEKGQTGSTNVWYENFNIDTNTYKESLIDPSSAPNLRGHSGITHLQQFYAPITGYYTHAKLRVYNAGQNDGGGYVNIDVGIYEVETQTNYVVDQYLPGAILKKITSGTIHSYGNFSINDTINIEFESGGTELIKNTKYFIALRVYSTFGSGNGNDGWFTFWGRELKAGSNRTTMPNNLTKAWVSRCWREKSSLRDTRSRLKNNLDGSIAPTFLNGPPSDSELEESNEVFWYVLYGPQTAAGATKGEPGTSGSKGENIIYGNSAIWKAVLDSNSNTVNDGIIKLDSTTTGKKYTGDLLNFYDAGGKDGKLVITNNSNGASSSDGNIIFDAGVGKTWELTFNDFDFPHTQGDFNHFGQLSIHKSDNDIAHDAAGWSEASVSWFTDTNGHRAVSDRVSGAYTTGEWIKPGNVVPAYWLVAYYSYGAPSDRKVTINSRYIKFTYKNSVKNENHAHGGDGWDITLKGVGSSNQTGISSGYFAVNNNNYSTANSIKIHYNSFQPSGLNNKPLLYTLNTGDDLLIRSVTNLNDYSSWRILSKIENDANEYMEYNIQISGEGSNTNITTTTGSEQYYLAFTRRGQTGDTGLQGLEGAKGDNGTTGGIGIQGSQGIIGGGNWRTLNFSRTINDNNVSPGDGNLQLNQNWSDIKITFPYKITISHEDNDSPSRKDIMNWINSMDNYGTPESKGILQITQTGNIYKRLTGKVTNVDKSFGDNTYSVITVTVIDINTVTSDGPPEGEEVIVSFTPNGSKGEIGITGSKGEVGVDGSKGEIGITGSKGEVGAGGTLANLGAGSTMGVTILDKLVNPNQDLGPDLGPLIIVKGVDTLTLPIYTSVPTGTYWNFKIIGSTTVTVISTSSNSLLINSNDGQTNPIRLGGTGYKSALVINSGDKDVGWVAIYPASPL